MQASQHPVITPQPYAPHPFVTSTVASVAEHVETARILLARLSDQPTVIEVIHDELTNALTKLANVQTLLKAQTEAAQREANASRDIDHAGTPLGVPVRMSRPTSDGEPREDER